MPNPSVDLSPPWPTPALWRAVNDTMAVTIERYQVRLNELKDLAGQIRARIVALDHIMDSLCVQTCPDCRDNCCQRATVWYDFKDLVGLHLGPGAIPPGQLIGSVNQTCRYLSSTGCVLPRAQRPFVCTWFICHAQKEVLKQGVNSQRAFIENSLTAIKKGRNELEEKFVRIVASYP